MSKKILGLIVRRLPTLLLGVQIGAGCQGKLVPGESPAFEVAVIKPAHAKGDSVMRTIKPLPGGNGYFAENFPVRLMIALMYKVPLRQVEGGPKWLDDEYFDIEAHADGVCTAKMNCKRCSVLCWRRDLDCRCIPFHARVRSSTCKWTARNRTCRATRLAQG